MPYSFAAVPCLTLKPQSTLAHPTTPPELVKLGSPAVSVMTTFKAVHPVTTRADVRIDAALDKMKTAGVRLLFVVNDAEEIVGLITAKDIMGERPIKFTQETRIPRAEITVAAVMTPQGDICALDAHIVRDARVGDIVETLSAQHRQHALVVKTDKIAHTQTVIGMFSTSQISKLLGYDVVHEVQPANSLAELVAKKIA